MKSKYFDKVIVSSDDSPMFLNFWPIVCQAWKKYFDITPTLAFVSNRDSNDSLIKRLSCFGEVVVVPEVEKIPAANQAKVARFLVASSFAEQVCMIEDIDTIPLQRDFFERRLSLRPKNKVLTIGKEVYENTPHRGKFPISNITAEGSKFKELFNPRSLSYDEAIRSFIGTRTFDNKEDISNPPHEFSDESLIRALIHANNFIDQTFEVRRDVDIRSHWIDRSWWSIDEAKLKADAYVICNFLRPFKENVHQFTPIVRHVYGNYPDINELVVL